MPKEWPNLSKDADRLMKTGRAKDEEEARRKLEPQEKLLKEREEHRAQLNDLRKKAEPSEKEVRAELERRLGILKQAYERRKSRLEEHYRDMLKAGVSPHHEEETHVREKLSQIEKDFQKERGLFEQFDAEERLIALRQFGEAIRSKDSQAIKIAQRKLEDMVDEQGLTSNTWNREGEINRLFRKLKAWIEGEIEFKNPSHTPGEKEYITYDDYQGVIRDGYLAEPLIERTMESNCQQAKFSKVEKSYFCFECPGTYKDLGYSLQQRIEALR